MHTSKKESDLIDIATVIVSAFAAIVGIALTLCS